MNGTFVMIGCDFKRDADSMLWLLGGCFLLFFYYVVVCFLVICPQTPVLQPKLNAN